MVVISCDPSTSEEAEACRISFHRIRKKRKELLSALPFFLLICLKNVCLYFRGCGDCVCSGLLRLTIIQRYWGVRLAL